MAKGGKSSASSGTRKKHARKAAAAATTGQPSIEEQPQPEKQKKVKKGSRNKEPRQKVYIPPVKPAPIQPDPLGTTGIANLLPPDLVVVLRKLGKKNAVTKIVALEELQTAWVNKYQKQCDERSSLLSSLSTMLPVWIHHIPSLFVHPSRRVRFLAIGLHASLLHIEDIRDQFISFLTDASLIHQCESILGTWGMAAHDIDRQVSSVAIKSWTDVMSFSEQDHSGKLALRENILTHFLLFIQRALLDPVGVYSYLNPTPPPAPTPPRKVADRSTPVRVPRKEDPEASRSKAEDEVESEQDRRARLRVSALGVMTWILDTTSSIHNLTSVPILVDTFGNPALWTSLHHAESSPIAEVESFGFNQPAVRKAGWTLLHSLLRGHKQSMFPILPILSSAVLRSAWVEPDQLVRGAMLQPLLSFLKDFPSAWELESAFVAHNSQEPDERSDEGSDDEGKGAENPQELAESTTNRRISLAYQEFLRFLELGCSGSPLLAYPTVVIIVSTLSPVIIASSPSPTPLTDFFTSFWAAVDGRALSSLERASTAAAFLSSLLECLVFFVRRILKDPAGQSMLFGSSPMEIGVESELRELVKNQYAQTWESLTSKRLRADYSAAGNIIAHSLMSLDHLRPELFQSAWNFLAKGLKTEVSTASTIGPSIVPAFLDSFDKTFKDGSVPAAAARSLIRDIIQSSFQQCENILGTDVDEPASLQSSIAPLANNLSTFGPRLFTNSEYSECIDKILIQHAYRLLSLAPSLLLAYLSHRGDEQKCLQLWHVILGVIAQHSEAASSVLATLLEAANKGLLPTYLRPQSDELDNVVNTLFTEVEGDPKDTSAPDLLCLLVKKSEYFLSDASFRGLLKSLVSSFTTQVYQSLRDPVVAPSGFGAILKLVEVVINARSRRPCMEDASTKLLPDLIMMGYLTARLDEYRDSPSLSAARDIWIMWLKESSTDLRDPVFEAVKAKFEKLLADIGVRIKPGDILQTISDGCPGLHVDLILDIFPSREKLDELLDELSSNAIHQSLGVVDPLIPPDSMLENQPISPRGFDERGYSPYARVVEGLSYAFAQDRKLAKENMWALRHLLALGLYASDLMHVPWASSLVFGPQVMKSNLHDLITRIQQITTYLLTSSADDGWRSRVVGAMLNNKPLEGSDALAFFLMNFMTAAKRMNNIREARILRNVLQHVLDEADRDEADQWVLLAQKMEKTSPEIMLSIVSSVTQYAPEPPRLDRYRNELASNLLGISATKADTEGLLILHRLSAVAPDPDSEIVFLPQQRAVNVVKTFQRWISSDEDVGEDVESAMTAILVHLTPILHTIPGSHWDFIFDIVENNLENCAFVDDSTWVLLARTLRLILAIQDLASANKSFRAEWQNRQKPILVLVKDAITTPLDDVKASSPRSICRELALKVLQNLPSSMIDQNTLPKMCHLLTDSSSEVQKMSYQFLQEAAKKWTEHVVIEAAVDASGETKAELPPELLDLLVRNVYDPDETESNSQGLFGYFLCWMITFDLFTNASLRVRSSYIDHLRRLQLIDSHFIPTILNLLHLYNGISKGVKLDIWGVDEFYVQYCEPDMPTSLQILAAHLYYRSLLTIPSLIRAWVLERKDRQLYMTMVNYTSQYFSQVLTQAELAHLKSPESMAELADEHMTVKVASSVNEVTASYTIDEHQLEITLKLPSDWPLHPIEVKDTKKVAVVENRWRAWMLGVQQTIWAHNGRIVDGLSLFKRNVALHFEGQVECAICYSIISVTDQSLPRKPCKTCRNRFHSGCLYKWFNTSHTSSCPLCRSDFI